MLGTAVVVEHTGMLCRGFRFVGGKEVKEKITVNTFS